MKAVISLGGSVLMSDFNADRIKKYANTIEKISKKNKVFVVVGGGKIARDYIEVARKLGVNETSCDYMGIEVTRLNASILASSISDAPRRIPSDFREAYELSKFHSVVVMGGTFPGHTTDATAALLSEFVNADILLIATSVDGVYSADPLKDKDAIRYDRLSAKELVEIVSKGELKAGSKNVVDLLAAKVIERSRIKTVVFYGTPENIEKAMNAEVGTIIG